MVPISVSRSVLVASCGVSSSRAFSFARPKSSSLTLSRVSMMLPGLRSACTTPCRCAWSSASAIRIAARNARSSGNGPSASRAARVTPSTYSITRKIAGPSSPTSCSVQICGWVMRATASASRRNRSILSAGRVQELAREHLDGDRPIEPRIAGPIHFAHPPGAERRQDLERAKTGAGRESHRMGRREAV